MSYENAPATKMLATHCCICSRPLLDAASVEMGIGPDCRKKYGYDIPCSPEQRTQANVIVHGVALDRSPQNVLTSCRKLRELGFEMLAATIEVRVATVVIRDLSGVLAVETPFNDQVVWAMRSIPGRRWDKDNKVNTFPATSKTQLWVLFKRFWPGELGVGPKGAFLIS